MSARTETASRGELPFVHLRFAVFDILADRKGRALLPGEVEGRLPREEPERVQRAVAAMLEGRDQRCGYGAEPGQGTCRIARRERALRQPLLQRRRLGMTLCEVAEVATKREGLQVGVAAIRALLTHHGYLECAPFGGRQRRTLCTDRCVTAGLGHNVHSPRSGTALKRGVGSTAPFPVLYPERLHDVLWTLGIDQIKEHLAGLTAQRMRLSWLSSNHDYLPARTVAAWSGASLRSAEGALARARSTRSSTD